MQELKEALESRNEQDDAKPRYQMNANQNIRHRSSASTFILGAAGSSDHAHTQTTSIDQKDKKSPHIVGASDKRLNQDQNLKVV